MNLVSRIAGAARLLATGKLAQSSGLEGAQMQRRLMAWRAGGESINSLILQGGELQRARARQLVRTNPYAANAAASFTAHAVGCGIKPSSLVEDGALKDRIQRLWLAWTDEADADGVTDFYGLQAMAARAMFEAGECFLRFRPRRPEDGLAVPLQLQMLSAEHLPLGKCETVSNGNEIIFGIELDRIGRRVAYHFHRTHPGDVPQRGMGELVRVPAEQVCHVFHPIAEGQIRGVPWVAPAMVRLWLLDQYDDAELDRKKVAAMFAGFVTRPGAEDVMGEDSAQKDQDGAALVGLQPGTMQLLLPGEDIKFSDPADVGGSYEAFQYRTLLACCSAMGVPYTNVTGDLRQANYSSLREGKLEFRRRIEQFQHNTLVFQLCRPVWSRWLRDAVLSGALDLPGFAESPAPYVAVKWIPPKWDWVDPLKDRKAEIEAIEAGLKSRSDVIESEGYDAEEVDRRIAADHAREEELGLKFGPAATARVDPAVEVEPEDRDRPNQSEEASRVKRWYEFRAQMNGAAEIVIYDEIGAFGIPAKAFLDELKALGPVAELTVRINSPGGSVFDGVAIYNALKRHSAAITVWIDGIAASIASMIAMAGDEVVMPENAMLMLHDPSGLVIGTAADMRAMAEALDKMKAGMVAAYRDKSGRNDAEIEALMAAETWLSAQEAVDLGLADRVEAPVRMAAHFDLSRFRNPPPQLAALAATPSPQEDDMSDSKKASSRKSGLDESATPQAAPPETNADDTAAGPASQPAAVAEPEPARPAELPPQASAQVIDLDAVRADERRATLAYVAEVHELCALAARGDLAAGFVAKATPVAQIRRALLEARAAEDEATAIRSQVRPASVEMAQPAIDTAAIYAARNQNVR